MEIITPRSRADIPAVLPTAEAAAAINRAPQTLRKWDIGNRVERRCCLLFHENREYDIRNRYELIVLLIGLVASR